MRHTGFAPGKRLPSTTKQEQKRRVGIWRIAAPKFLDLAVRSTLVFSCAPSGYKFMAIHCRMCAEFICKLAGLLIIRFEA
eukprot:scaffold168879_cov16-Tisochrysis_lutea.AAC.1